MQVRIRLFIASALTLASATATAGPYVFGHATIGTSADGTLGETADVDNDGRVDVVAIGTTGVTILLAQADGTFVPAAVPVPSLGANLVANHATASDLDGDGNVDLAVTAVVCDPVTGCAAGSITVLFGHGDGSFELGPQIDTAPFPLDVAAADLDGNGTLDLAVAAEGSNIDTGAPGFVTIVANRGTRTFESLGSFDAGAGVRGVHAAKIDGDDALDLVVLQMPTLANDAVAWLPGIGDGTFSAPKRITTGPSPVALAVADVDGDGATDLVVPKSDTFTVLHGDGAGAFTSTDYPALFGLSEVDLADLDGDGKLDIVATAAPISAVLSGDVVVLFGQSDGGFSTPTAVVTGTLGHLEIADLDHDGTLDVAVGSASAVAAVVRGGPHGPVTPTVFTTPTSYWVTQEADVDGDGALDLIAAYDGCAEACPCATGTLATYAGNGHGGFAFAQPIDSVTTGHVAALTVGDFDGDAKPDLAVLDSCAGTVGVSRGDGSGGFAAPTAMDLAIFDGRLLARDVDADGSIDLIATSSFDDIVSVLLGHGDGSFAGRLDFTTSPGPTAVVDGDFNGDGKLDLAVAASATPVGITGRGKVSILVGNGDGTFAPAVDAEIGSISPVDLVAGSLDGDAVTDLAVYGRLGFEFGVVATLIGTGDGTFTFAATATTIVAKRPSSMTGGDFDGDGHLDLVLAMGGSDLVRLMRGNADGSFRPAEGFGPATAATLHAGDIDGDGLPDLVASSALGFGEIYSSACVDQPCPGGGGGDVDAGPGGGDIDGGGGTDDAGTGGHADGSGGGCGCRTGSDAGTGGTLALAALAIMVAPRRRRPARP